MVPKWSENGPKMIQKWSPKWSQDGSKMVPKWSVNPVLLTIFIYIEKQRLKSNFSQAYIELKTNLKKNLVIFLATREAVFENSKMIDWSLLSRCFHKNLKIWNPSIIGHFIVDSIGRVRRGRGGPHPPQPPLSPSFILQSPLVHSQFIVMQQKWKSSQRKF